MILDSQNMFSNAQAVTVTANSSNVIDLSVARDLGPGEDIDFFALINTTFTGATSMVVALVTADNAALSSNPIVLQQTDVIAEANLTAGTYLLRGSVNVSRVAPKRYLGVVYTVVGTHGAGAITAGLIKDQQANIIYASGLNVGGF